MKTTESECDWDGQRNLTSYWTGRPIYRCVTLLALLAGNAMGCHGLRSGRQTQQLSTARQFSLRGADYLQQQKLNHAEELFSEALRHSSADERAQWGMAEILWQQGKQPAAIEHMALAVKISGDNPDLLVRLGEMNLELGAFDQALAQSNQALQSHRQHAGAWALRGRVLHRGSQLAEAMECYHRALIYQPGLIDVQLSLAELYREQGRPQRALATVQRISDSIPDEQLSPKAWLLQGQALADLGEIDAAYGCLANAALCASDADTEVLLELAETQFAHGDVVRAKQCVDRALRHDPQNPQALTWLETLAQPQQLQGARGELVGFEQSTHGN